MNIFFIKNFFSSNDYVQHPVELTWKSFFDSTLFYPIGFMWFLPTLFMIFVLFVFIARLIGFTNDRTWWWLGIAGGVWGIAQCMPHIQFLQMFNAISYSVYFIVGIIYAIWKKTIDYWLMKYKWIGLSVFSACSFSLLLPSVIAALIGIVWVLSLSLLVSEKVQNKFMAVSNYSFTIYLLSYFPQMLIRWPIYHHFEWINEYVFSVLSILLGVFVPIGIGRVYSHIKDVNKLTKFLGNIIGL